MSNAGCTKWGGTVGVREKRDFIKPVPGFKLCGWHKEGVPHWAQDQAWLVEGCPTCAAKVASGKVPANAPAPRELIRLRKFGRWANRARIEKQRKAQRAFEASLVPGRTA